VKCRFCPRKRFGSLNGIDLCEEHYEEALAHCANVPGALLDLARMAIYGIVEIHKKSDDDQPG